jgi:hypothetical protein
MDKKNRRITALLSCLLPGLGQVYQKRFGEGLLFFGVFVCLLWFPVTRPYIFLVVLASAYEAHRRHAQREEEEDPTWKLYVFFSGGFLAFFGWFILAGSDLLPFSVQLRMQSRIDPLVKELKSYKVNHGYYPESLVEMVSDRAAGDTEGEPLQTDPWGRPFDYRKTESGFELRSAGRDGVFGNKDDYVYRLH